jgi:hypothetical protein
VAVHYWTVNDVSEMQHLIDIGADGITTDYPHLLAQVLAAQEENGSADGTETVGGSQEETAFGTGLQLVGPKGE